MWTPRHETGRDGSDPWSGGRTTRVAAVATASIRQPLALRGSGSSGLRRAVLDVGGLVAGRGVSATAGRATTAVRSAVQALTPAAGLCYA